MTSNKHDGKKVIVRDAIGMRHEGFVVGQTEDGAQVLVKSTNEKLPTAIRNEAWHFSIASEQIEQYLT